MAPVPDLTRQHQVIDLVSDDEDTNFLDLDEDNLDRYFNEDILDRYFDGPIRGVDEYLDESSTCSGLNSLQHTADNLIDLTGPENTSDIDVAPVPLSADTSMTVNKDEYLANNETITEAACLQLVLDVLPDISIEHVLGLIHETTQDNTRTPVECERIITQILDGGDYPKEQDEESSRKRKRVDDDDVGEFESGTQNVDSPHYSKDA